MLFLPLSAESHIKSPFAVHEVIRYLVIIKLIFTFAHFFRCNVNNPEQYQIAFSGLKPGTHTFNFKIGKLFFDQVEDAEIRDGQVLVTVTMIKEERMIDLHFDLLGKVMVSCDRCYELMDV